MLRLRNMGPVQAVLSGAVLPKKGQGYIKINLFNKDMTPVTVVPAQAAAQADSTAADAAALKTDFNALLAKLRAAGVIKSS